MQTRNTTTALDKNTPVMKGTYVSIRSATHPTAASPMRGMLIRRAIDAREALAPMPTCGLFPVGCGRALAASGAARRPPVAIVRKVRRVGPAPPAWSVVPKRGAVSSHAPRPHRNLRSVAGSRPARAGFGRRPRDLTGARARSWPPSPDARGSRSGRAPASRARGLRGSGLPGHGRAWCAIVAQGPSLGQPARHQVSVAETLCAARSPACTARPQALLVKRSAERWPSTPPRRPRWLSARQGALTMPSGGLPPPALLPPPRDILPFAGDPPADLRRGRQQTGRWRW